MDRWRTVPISSLTPRRHIGIKWRGVHVSDTRVTWWLLYGRSDDYHCGLPRNNCVSAVFPGISSYSIIAGD
jgi:hypothetical protein